MKNFLKIGTMILLCLFCAESSAQFNYGEALQKSLLFYEMQQSGKLPDWNRISWRSDSGVNDGADVGLDLTGGWNDAGDHVKFGFPMAFSVTALNWGFLEYQDGYETANQTEHFKRNIKWVTDYFIKCHPSPNVFYAQVADSKSQDHNFWMPAEMVDVHPMYGQRKSYALTTSNPGTEVACETAAALASASIIFKDSDPAYSAELLSHAIDLYEFGDTYRGLYTSDGNIPADGTYTSGNFQDELTWGALWLYKATGDQAYLDKAEAEYAQPDFLWSLVWEDKSYGNMVLLSIITGKDTYKVDAERHLDWWQEGGGVNYSPGGQAHLTQWGSLRHAMNASLTALIYSDNVDTPKSAQYRNFAINQVNYALGDNPNNRSLVTGFGVNPPTKPHHRGQHSSWTRSSANPVESRHTMWGALMGGPSSPNDAFEEDRDDFQANEVATDYNACYQGVLARMVMEFGGSPLSNFPPVEEAGLEYANEVKLNNDQSLFTEVAIWLNNRTGWPARVPNTLTARYFVNISEGIAAGFDVDDYELTARGAGNVTVGNLIEWDASANIYYAEIEVDSDKMPFPGGQGEYRSEIQLRVSLPTNAPASAWDPSNDFSYQGLTNGLQIADNVPIYADGVLAGGNEPTGGEVPSASFTATPESGVIPLEVSFDASASSDPNGDTLTYNWDFGNGETSSEVDPLILYTEVGSYLVTLTVSDGTNTSSEVNRTITVEDDTPTIDGGIITGGPFEFTVGDGIADNVSGVSLAGNVGANSQWVVTDDQRSILGLPGAIEAVDFDGAGSGTCFIYHLSYEDGLTGLAAENNLSVLVGDFDLSNRIEVLRTTVTSPGETDGGTITGGPFAFTVGDGIADNVSGVSLAGNVGANSQWVVTDNQRNILGLPGAIEAVDFDGAGSGTCFIYHLSYEDGLTGLAAENNLSVLEGDFDLSNRIEVLRTTVTTGGGDCTFGAPTATSLASINTSFDNTFVLGTGGPNLDVVTTFTINWDLANNGLYQFSFNLNTNPYYVDFSSSTQNFNSPSPSITLTGTNITGLDGSYYATIDDGNFALVSQSGGFTIYFSKSSTAPDCGDGGTQVDGGTITGGPFAFTVGDGIADNVSGVSLAGNVGANSQWVVTDDQRNILGLPGAIEAVDFDGAGSGTCFIYHLSYEDGLTGLAAENNLSVLEGDYDLSNRIEVLRTIVTVPTGPDGGTITGGPFAFAVGDGIADNVSGVSLTGNVGANSQWVVTDDQRNILGLPGAVEAVDFDGAGSGTCFIYHLSYEDGLTGLAAENNLSILEGDFDLSNRIEVVRTTVTIPTVVDGGTIAGGPFAFTVGDGIADNVSGVSLAGNIGANSQWVVTDDQRNILGLPGAIEAVDFDGAGSGTCFIYHLSYEDGLTGLAAENNLSVLEGDYDLSNRIEVVRTTVTTGGGDCTFGTPTATSLASINTSFDNTFVLGTGGPNLDIVTTFTINWDLANNGLYQFSFNLNTNPYYVDFSSSTQNFNVPSPSITLAGTNITGLDGSYYATIDDGNFVLVSQSGGFTIYFSKSSTAPDCGNGGTQVDGGTITGGPFAFTVGDGIADNVSGVSLAGNVGANSQWVVTDDQRNILGLPGAIEAVDFDGAGSGTCFIYHLSYEDGLTGLAAENNLSVLEGDFDLSNRIEVVRTTVTNPGETDGGTITGGPFEFTVGDGVADNVSGVSLTGNVGANSQWVVTDDQRNILGLPGAIEAVDFDGAGSGTCFIYHLSYEDGLTGLAAENNLSVLEGDYDLSNRIEVIRNEDTGGGGGGGGGSTDNAYIDRFVELRNEIYNPENGYFSADGSPHHSIETLIVEAPDYGHESTSELYSYWMWMEAMHGRISGDWAPLSDVWDKTEQFIIPTNDDQPTNAAYNPSSPAAYAAEFPLPSGYPAPLNFSAPVGIDPISPDLTATYGADIYQMHWLLDNDNFYGYGNRGDGVSTPSYINTFQRGEEESVYETIPHPSWESFDWGGTDGFLPLFVGDQNYVQQWRYTSAPDADARAVQAMYWAQVYAKEQGANLGNLDLDKASKMGDYLRLSMFDKYFKPLGVQSETSGAGTGYDSAHYLMSWFMSWGGAADTSAPWAFRISASHCHFGYQNPVAAYALTQVDELKPISNNGERDWNESLNRQMEFYTWLQSNEGAIAGGATNSWNGNYSPYPAGTPTFYDMAFDTNPVYHDPGSGTWFGWQAWSMERVAEYYYITNDPMAKNLIDKWTTWVESEVQLIGENDFLIPATLEWTGEPDTWDPNSPGTNSGLSVSVVNYSVDLGVAASMAKALIYYAAATEKYATLDVGARDLAKEVLDRMWITYRDEEGLSSTEARGDFSRIFEQEVYVPGGFTGTMSNGEAITPGVSFLDLRTDLRNDPEFDRLEAAYEAGEDFTQNYHRTWAQMEIALANAEFGFFFGDEDSVKANVPQEFIVTVSPNPANDFIDISTNFEMKNTRVRIIDITGKVVKTESMQSKQNSARISVSNLPTGMYIAEILDITSKVTRREKIIKN